MSAKRKKQKQSDESAARLRAYEEVLRVLKPFPRETQRRLLKATAILLGVELEGKDLFS